MNGEFINPFIANALNVIQTMAGLAPVAGEPNVKSHNLTWGVVTGIIGMAGDKIHGNLVISFDQISICKIVSNLLDEEITSVNDDVVDAVGEITNMVSGGTKRDLADQGFQFAMATPIMIVGKNVELRQMSLGPIIQVPFDVAGGRFVVEATLAPKR